MAGLQQQLGRLRVPHPVIAAQAVAGVFAALRAAPGLSPATCDAAIHQCLCLTDAPAVEVAVQQLLSLAQSPTAAPGGSRGTGVTPLKATDLLLTALSVAGPATVGPLVAGLLELFVASAAALGSQPGAPAATWRAHPLARALLAHPAAAQPLLLGVARLLGRAAAGRDGTGAAAFPALLSALAPFISWVLLDPQLSQQQPLLAPALHATLARLACSLGGAPGPQLALLALLTAHLPAWPVGSPAQQAAAAAALGDVMDVVEACEEEPAPITVAALLNGVASLCRDAAPQGAGALLQQAAAAARRLAGYWPGAAPLLAAPLAPLLLGQQALPGATEARALLPLLAELLLGGAPGSRDDVAAAALEVPLVQLLAFGSGSNAVGEWAAYCMRQLSTPAAAPGDRVARKQGTGGQLPGATSLALLWQLWGEPAVAQQWLASLHLTLASSSGTGGMGKLAGGREQRQLSPPTLLVLCSLLSHPEERVASAAVGAATAAAAAAPLLGLTLLPLLVLQLQRAIERFLSGKQRPRAGAHGSSRESIAVRPSHVLLELLQALPLLARHPAALPFVLRALQPLLAPGAPALLQAAGLRLVCALWVGTGRGFQQLRTAIIGYAAPGTAPALELRIARAECLRDVCLELVGLIQECLVDEAPAVQAAGLDCVAELCEQARAQTRGEEEARARDMGCPRAMWPPAWNRLRTLREHQRFAANVCSSEPLCVRRQAYASLASFEFPTLEELEALRPLVAYVALLQQEHALARQQRQLQQVKAGWRSKRLERQLGAAQSECEALVMAAVAHEHATRRRPHAAVAAPTPAAAGGGTGGEKRAVRQAAAATAAAMTHRLVSALPKQMLGGAAPTAAMLLPRIPELPAPAVAVLLFWSPPPPAGKTPAQLAAGARQAAEDYQALACELIRQPQTAAQLAAAAGAEAGGEAAACGAWLVAWRRFLRRWAAALRAAGPAGGGEGAGGKGEGSSTAQHAAVLQIWQAIQPHLCEQPPSPAAAENAAWAAAALCSLGAQPVAHVVAPVHAALTRLLGDGKQATAVRAAAAKALGAVAEPVRLAQGQATLLQLTSSLRQILLERPSGLVTAPALTLRDAAAVGLALATRQLAPAAGQVADAAAAARAAAESVLAAYLQAGTAAGDSSSSGGAVAGALSSALAAALSPAAQLGLLPQQPSLEQLHASLLAQLEGGGAAATVAAPLLAAVAAVGFQLGSLGEGQVTAALDALVQAAAQALEQLALRDQDPRTRRGASWALAHLCIAVKQGGGGSSDGGRPRGAGAEVEAAAAARGLQQLPPEGALRPLVESLHEGRWMLPQEGSWQGQAGEGRDTAAPMPQLPDLSAAEAAAVLRCLAAAPRLPPLSWAALCRKLLRTFGADLHADAAGLCEACVALASVHGSKSPAFQLADFIATDLLAPARLAALTGRARLAALRSLAPLLAALPEAPAVAALRAACQQSPDLSGSSAAAGAATAARGTEALALLEGLLHLVAPMPEGSSDGRSASSPALREAAQRCLTAVLLLKLPPAPALPVSLAALAEAATAEDGGHRMRLLGPEQRCWAAALACLAELPEPRWQQLPPASTVADGRGEGACPPVHLAYASALLVAAGAADAGALQQARNLLLGGGAGVVGSTRDSSRPPQHVLSLLALLVGRGVAALPLGQQQQWLGDALDATQVCDDPASAFRMAACMVAACAAASQLAPAGGESPPQLAADHCWASSCTAAVATLPEALAALMGAPGWQHLRGALLHRLGRALRALPASSGLNAARLQRACLLAARHPSLPDEQWAALAACMDVR
eukprot:scaffold10.g2269.t1